MENFKYSLDKSSKKHSCPDCLEMTFVLYVENETGNYLTGDFGRCDRETNCSYHKAPAKSNKAYLIDFLMLYNYSELAYKMTDKNGFISIIPKSQVMEISKNNCWITEWFLNNQTFINYLSNDSKYFNKQSDEVVINTVTTKEPTPEIEPSFHAKKLFKRICFEKPQTDNLTEFLKEHFSKDEILKAKQNYFISGTNLFWNNSTMFWQIDENDKIHACKIMQYDKHTGKRIKKPYNRINWLHNAIKEPDFNLCQCLFGLHRINEDHQKTIAIVESEKTAIVMSLFVPDFIWLATGSKQNLKFDLLKPIKKRNIVLFPDKGEFDYWSLKANELNKVGFKIGVSELIEQTENKNGFDLADYYFLTDE